MNEEHAERARILLKAARDLLYKQKKAYFVLNLLEETVHYDEADCDGSCLIDDIDALLEEMSEDPPHSAEYSEYSGMKLRDIIKAMYPNKVDAAYQGGVSSCPINYIWDSSYALCKGKLGPTASCSDCWDQIHEGIHKSRKD